MSITSLPFILLCLVFPFFNFGEKSFKLVLGIGSLCFIVLSLDFSLVSILITIGFILIPYFLDKIVKKKWIIIVIVLLMFLYLNRYDFLVALVPNIYVFSFRAFSASYILFREIDYISLKNKEGSLLDYFCYISSFYTILAGPIESYNDFLSSISHRISLGKTEVLSSFNRILNGYIKLVGISYICSKLSAYFNDKFLLFAFFNLLYVYFNFSGYSDVVISFAKLAGLSVVENFNKPLLSRSVEEFWRKWHISLSSWLRTHVYFPLGGSRRGVFRTYINILIVFAVSGLWHGLNLNSLVFGLLQGIGVCLSKVYVRILNKVLKDEGNMLKFRERVKPLEIALTIIYESIAFVFLNNRII